MVQLVCEELTLGYDRPILTGLSFEVNAGDYLFILGENGAGKSTLMKTVLGLIPPLAGKITRGEGLSAGKIGYLPQQTRAQRDFPASVREVVQSGCLGRRRGLRALFRRGKSPGGTGYGTHGHHSAGGPVLPGAFGRTAAAGFAGTGALCGGFHAAL